MPRTKHNRAIRQAKAVRLVPCPPRLKAILDALEKLPPGIELANLSYLLKESPEVIREDLVEYLKQLPGEFVRQIWVRNSPYSPNPGQWRRAAVEAGLLFLADGQSDEQVSGTARDLHATYLNVWRSVLIECEFLRRSALVLTEMGKVAQVCVERNAPVLTVSLLPAVIKISEKGVADVARLRLAEAIDGADLSRVRECAICGRIFWAGRSDKTFCLESCGNKLRKNRSPAYALNRKVKETDKDWKERKTKRAKTAPKR